MSWRDRLEKMGRRNVPLARRTTFRIGGEAAWLIEPPDEATFAGLYGAALHAGWPVYVLGAGSNLLIADEGVEGVVFSTARLRGRQVWEGGARARVGAGAPLPPLVAWAAREGLRGLECATGIPGTVGGAVRMNAGTRAGAIGDRVARLWYAGPDGGVHERAGRDVAWRYRGSDIVEPILAVELTLERDDARTLKAARAEALSARRAAQPVDLPSAGCFFKNPPGDSAGRLIDAAGLKGASIGRASVSVKHANFIVNTGGATASDVRALGDVVCRRVWNRFGVVLEREVCFWPAASTQGGRTL